MKIIYENLAPIDNYTSYYEIQMNKPVDFKLLEELCNIKEADYYFTLELADDDEFEMEWDTSK
ncbi:MAG: hypothetical protein IJ880_14985, partial [Bacilli bacterium]|nr:hypothetical protein [Bacilli bacterium]